MLVVAEKAARYSMILFLCLACLALVAAAALALFSDILISPGWWCLPLVLAMPGWIYTCFLIVTRP